MGAFVAALPAIEIAATELPSVINLGLEIVNGIKGIFHRGTDQKFPPVDVATMQAMSLAGMRTKLAAAFPDVSVKLTDAQVQMFMEILYQSQKAVTAITAPTPAPATLPVNTADSTALMIGTLILGALKLLPTLLPATPASA